MIDPVVVETALKICWRARNRHQACRQELRALARADAKLLRALRGGGAADHRAQAAKAN